MASLLHFKPFSHSGRHLDEARKTIASPPSAGSLLRFPRPVSPGESESASCGERPFSVDLYARTRDANGATDISLLAIIVVTISAHLVNLNEGKETKNTREEELQFWGLFSAS